ncbi:MAG TPA: 2OG-Fe(II) oxygenase family protein [Burkholderiaceae bacterium]|nr:2OG-Fe(II) oxygenase family protein [Burkholderiaceae bacterium]
MVEQIPVVDIARPDSAASHAAIDRACRDWGFFQVIGHGLDRTLIERMFTLSREFFAQPLEAKQAISRDANNPWGYFDRELTKNKRDWKEIYDYGPADGWRLQPRWPTGELRHRFEPTVLAYYDGCKALALRLLAAIAANLGVEPDLLACGFDSAHTSFLRLNHYPPHPQRHGEDGAALGVGQHTDSGALTVLLQDDQPGLEVLRGGRWHLVQPLAGALVINIGDIVQVWSNDRYTAALHRVITNPARDRYTMPFFLNPSYDTTYEPLPTTVSAHEPARYRRIEWREFRSLRAAGDYADLGEEVQISHYRPEVVWP